MRHLVLVAAAAVLVTGAGVTAGTLLADGDEPTTSGPPSFSTTPLDAFDTSTLTVPRASFCHAVDPRQVEAALGGEPVDAQSYSSGDEVTLAEGVTDVAHEFGCTWVRADQGEARAWVFAPPVDADRARRLVREATAGRPQDCQASPEPAYGAPSVGLLCTGEGGGRAAYQGLFGDAWLACELSSKDPEVSGAELLRRTGAWCVGVALAASQAAPAT
ncbi:hypothetical protein [Nocardioides dilutus]